MKKVKFFKLGAIALTMSSAALNVNAQVGINTENPKATLDIVQRDTATVKGKGFRLVDGHQNAGFVLTSDATGIGTWEASGVSMHLGYFPPTAAERITMPNQSTGWVATNAYIDLPPGIWRIDMSLLAQLPAKPPQPPTNFEEMWVHATFSSDISNLGTFSYQTSTEIGLTDGNNAFRFICNWVHKNQFISMIQGTLVIRNQSTLTKRFHLIVQNDAYEIPAPSNTPLYLIGAWHAENSMVAIPITSTQ